VDNQPAQQLNLSSVLSLLHLPDYRRLLGSNALWWAITFMETTAVGWVVFELTNSPRQVALIGFCRSLPFLLLGFFTGPITDRFGRRPVIVACQTANLIAYSAIMLLLWLDQLALWHLAVAALTLGSAWALDWPARRALLPDLVGKARTVDAMLLENFVQSLARITGPAAAGLLVAFGGPLGCYVVMMAVSTVTLLILRSLSHQPIPRTTMRPEASPWTLMSEGLRYAGHSQPILGVLLITLVMNLLVFPYMNLLPVFARDVLGKGPVGLGLLGAGTGVGAFIGLFVISRLRDRVSNGWIFGLGTSGMCLALLAFALSTGYELSWMMLLLAGIGQACFGIMQSSIILLTASDEMRSRALGTLVLAIGADPLGKLQTGILAERFGAPPVVAAQAGLAALTIIALTLALPGLRRPVAAQRHAQPTLSSADD